MCNPIKKMKHMNSSSAKTETDIQIPKANSWLPKGKHGRGRGGVVNQKLVVTHTHSHTHTHTHHHT